MDGDPDALANFDILPDIITTTTATAATVATTTAMLPHDAATSKHSSKYSLDRILKILQILLSVAAFYVIIGAYV